MPILINAGDVYQVRFAFESGLNCEENLERGFEHTSKYYFENFRLAQLGPLFEAKAVLLKSEISQKRS